MSVGVSATATPAAPAATRITAAAAMEIARLLRDTIPILPRRTLWVTRMRKF
jgi:hypothetical protein